MCNFLVLAIVAGGELKAGRLSAEELDFRTRFRRRVRSMGSRQAGRRPSGKREGNSSTRALCRATGCLGTRTVERVGEVDGAARYRWAGVYPGHGTIREFRDHYGIPGRSPSTRPHRADD